MDEKRAEVYYNNIPTGYLIKKEGKFIFRYAKEYLADDSLPSISLTLPKRDESYVSVFLFPFFSGLLAEGENKDIQCRVLKIDENDSFTRLLKTASENTIGGVTVKEIK